MTPHTGSKLFEADSAVAQILEQLDCLGRFMPAEELSPKLWEADATAVHVDACGNLHVPFSTGTWAEMPVPFSTGLTAD